MLGRWLFVRIRTAEKALDEGRLDEAYGIAAQPDLCHHRRAQKLLDNLVRPLLARARLHLQAGRYRDALDDLDRLRAIGRGGPAVDTLRQQAEREWHARQQRQAGRQVDFARAAANLEAGRLDSVRLAIEQLGDSRGRQELGQQLDVRERRAAQLLAQAGESLTRGDVLAALRLWTEARERHGRTREGDEFVAQLATACRRSFDDWFAGGQLESLLAARAALAQLCQCDPTLVELERISALCARAGVQLGRGDYAGLRETLLRLQAARSATAWLSQALTATAKIAEGQEALLASPLGLLASSAGHHSALPADGTTAAASPRGPQANAASPATDAAHRLGACASGAAIGARALLMLVDGAGSSLLLARDCVRIGRAGGSRPIDVPIPVDIQSHHADICRHGEDYFLIAYAPAQVNRRAVQRALLRDGDRVLLGGRAKFVFRQPSLRSASAVLRLSHRCRLEEDVSDVILFRDTCLIGPQATCHLRTQDADCQIVLFDHAGRLWGREAAAGGGKLGDPKPLVLGRTLEFGPLRVTVKTRKTGAA